MELAAFCADRYLVTQKQYLDFVTRGGHSPPAISREDYARQGFLATTTRSGHPISGGGAHRLTTGSIIPSCW
jgi:formylglycine-generating enzyme required for sulfatase activity